MLRRSGDLQTDEIHFKDRRNLVTEVDLACEALLVEGLRDLLPEANFQTEEGLVPGTDRGLRWVVDPLDGTTNFVHGLPIVSVSIALVTDQQVDLGVVYAPFQDEMFTATRGSGAFCNGQRLKVSRPGGLEDALLATGFPFQRFDRIQAYMEVLQTLMRQCRGLRRMGSAAIDLAYVASGRFDGYFEYNLQPGMWPPDCSWSKKRVAWWAAFGLRTILWTVAKCWQHPLNSTRPWRRCCGQQIRPTGSEKEFWT